jgi:hypothetical protein
MACKGDNRRCVDARFASRGAHKTDVIARGFRTLELLNFSTHQPFSPRLFARYKLRRLGIFGSYARGEQTERSDIDLLVEIDPSIGMEFVDLARELEILLGEPVDVVSTRAIKPRNRRTVEEDLIDV